MSEFNFNWKGKRVLITGHTGFKGTWLCLWMQLLERPGSRLCAGAPDAPEPARARRRRRRHGSDRRRHPRHGAPPGHLRSRPAGDRLPPRGAADRAARLRGSGRDLLDQHDGDRERARVRPPDAERASRSSSSPATSATPITSGTGRIARSRSSAAATPTPRARAAPSSSCTPIASRISTRSERGKPTALLASVRAGNVIGGGDWAPYRLVPDIIVDAARGPAARPAPPEGDPPLAARSRAAARLSPGRREPLQRRPAGGRSVEFRAGRRGLPAGRLAGEASSPSSGVARRTGRPIASRIRTRTPSSSSTAARPGRSSAGRRSCGSRTGCSGSPTGTRRWIAARTCGR